MRLIVGLGNPGSAYAQTRHNVGAVALRKAAERWAIPWRQSGATPGGRGRIGGVDVVLAVSLAWMNDSGPAVQALVERAGVSLEDLIIVHDDLDLPLGRIRIKLQGGAGGHRGLLSILTTLASDQFCRLKIGIGSPPDEVDPADYVLSPFHPEEIPEVERVLDRSVLALECLVTEGSEAAMNRFNVRAGSE